jgi:hypothetical protein
MVVSSLHASVGHPIGEEIAYLLLPIIEHNQKFFQ